MTIAKKIKEIADQISHDQNKEFGFSVNMYGLAEKVQTLLDEHFNKPIDECLKILPNIHTKDLASMEWRVKLSSILETMKGIK